MQPQGKNNEQIKIFSPSSEFGAGLVFSLFDAFEKTIGNNPLNKEHATPRGLITEVIERPLTIQGFICYCFENASIDVSKCFNGTCPDEYKGVVNYIRSKVAKQQIEQALIGNYNAGLVQRLNSIKETIEVIQLDETPILNLDFNA